MTLLSLNANMKHLVFAGTALAVLAGMAAPSQARVMTAAEFVASIEEVKYVCKRLDQPFWGMKRQYGCGEVVSCFKARTCELKKRKQEQRPPLTHALLALPDGPDDNDHGNGNPGGERGSKSRK
jgi:hypothetical protein